LQSVCIKCQKALISAVNLALSLYWQFGGFGAAAPTGSAASMSSSSQLVQAMASFAAPNAIDSSNAAPFDSGTSQQVNLLTPGHA